MNALELSYEGGWEMAAADAGGNHNLSIATQTLYREREPAGTTAPRFSTSLVCSTLLHLTVVGILFSVANDPVAEPVAVRLDAEPLEVSFVTIEYHTKSPMAGTLSPAAAVPQPIAAPAPPVIKPATPKAIRPSRKIPTRSAPPTPSPAVVADPTVVAAVSGAAEGSSGVSDGSSSRLGVPNGRGTEIGADYEQLVFSWLAKHKRYPDRARRRRITGEGEVRLTITRQGDVKEVAIARSTSSPLLDDELKAMVERADPFPQPPPNYTGETLAFVVPVSFTLE